MLGGALADRHSIGSASSSAASHRDSALWLWPVRMGFMIRAQGSFHPGSGPHGPADTDSRPEDKIFSCIGLMPGHDVCPEGLLQWEVHALLRRTMLDVRLGRGRSFGGLLQVEPGTS